MRNKVGRLIILIVVGAIVIWFSAWVTKPPELPSDVIIIRPLETGNNPYQREYDEMLYPTVRIETLTGRGSGVIIANTNNTNEDELTRIYILSAAHVVANQSIVEVDFYDSEIITGTVVITDTRKDLALIRVIRVKDIYSAKLAKKDYQYYLFAPVYVVGCSLGLSPRPSSGIISAINFDSVEVSTPVLPGNSGGPIYTADTHELIGIAVWVRLYGDQLVTTMAGIVPIGEIYRFLDGVKELQVTGYKF